VFAAPDKQFVRFVQQPVCGFPMIWFVAVTERVNYFIADTHPTLVHRISELLLTRLRPTSHRRVFTRRQPVDRVRPVDVGFQINVHCVSVRAVKPPTPEQQEMLDKLGDMGTRCESCGEPLPKLLEECGSCGVKRYVSFWKKFGFIIVASVLTAIMLILKAWLQQSWPWGPN
jgi:hypothetical protein